MDKLQRIKNEGFLVDVYHQRHALEWGFKDGFEPKGGMTTVEIKVEDKNLAKFAKRQQPKRRVTVEGISICSPKDSYNKKFGFGLALFRALCAARDVWPQHLELFEEIQNEILLTMNQNESK